MKIIDIFGRIIIIFAYLLAVMGPEYSTLSFSECFFKYLNHHFNLQGFNFDLSYHHAQ